MGSDREKAPPKHSRRAVCALVVIAIFALGLPFVALRNGLPMRIPRLLADAPEQLGGSSSNLEQGGGVHKSSSDATAVAMSVPVDDARGRANALAGGALVESVANEIRLKKAELDGVGYALGAVGHLAMQLNDSHEEVRATNARLDAALRSIEELRLQTAALIEPWNGHAGEIRCATGHRCASYIDAGKMNLTALSSVAACNDYCGRAYRHIGFFAFHNEHGWVAFMLDPKGRCRCYDTSPCELVPDGGYNLWSGVGSCSSDLLVPGQAAEERPAKVQLAPAAEAAAAAEPSTSLADPKAGA